MSDTIGYALMIYFAVMAVAYGCAFLVFWNLFRGGRKGNKNAHG